MTKAIREPKYVMTDGVRSAIESKMLEISRAHGTWIPAMLHPMHKDRKVVAARSELICWMRDNVYQTKGNDFTIWMLDDMSEGQRAARDFRALSYPMIGWILALDHSTILYARKRMAEKAAQELHDGFDKKEN